MGSGGYTTASYCSYSKSKGRDFDVTSGRMVSSENARQMFKEKYLNPALDIRKKIRECCDSAEHPNTVPVILALDVTGSMGGAAVEIAKSLNVIMTDIYKEVQDVEFSIMAIGDVEFDKAPVQMSQFESDIRIAENIDKIYFEGGGGSNRYESYTAAWWAGLHHTNLDCWKRGKKGIIITLGDEPLNPYLERIGLNEALEESVQSHISTEELYKQASEKFDIYHIAVDDSETQFRWYEVNGLKESYVRVLPEDHYKVATMQQLAPTIAKIIKDCVANTQPSVLLEAFDGGVISW